MQTGQDDVVGEQRQLLLALGEPDPAVGDAVVEMSVRVGPEVYTAQQNAIIARPDSRPLLPGIAVPTIVVVGEHDLLTPPPLAREMADLIPGAALHIVPEAGHLPPLEKPAAMSRILRNWLT